MAYHPAVISPSEGAAAAPASSSSRARRWARRLALAAGAVLVVALASALLLSWWLEGRLFTPPPLPVDHPALACPVIQDPVGIRRLGDAWVHEDEGIGEIFLPGDAVARGYAMASLCRETLDAQEDNLFRELDRLLPGSLRRALMRKAVLFLYRDLPAYVDPEVMLEAAAMVPALERSGPRPHADVFPIFHRVLFYQTLYDTGQSMAEAGLVDTQLGCTSVAVSGARSASGGLLLARNCDFEAGTIFDDRKLVFFVAPDGGARYVAVSWAGMLGVVSGVNAHGLVVMLHATRTDATKWPRVGRPVPLILRDALREDRTIDQVVERFRRSPYHGAALVVVGEGGTGRSGVIETDPLRTEFLEAEGGSVACANHIRSPAWAGDAVAATMARDGSSAQRLARAEELLAAAPPLDVAAAAALLRDRRGPGGAEVGLGNRSTIAALNHAHAIVYDAAASVLHVSRAPRGLGAFVAYDLRAFFAGGDPRGPSDVRRAGPPTVGAAPDPGSAAAVEEARLALREADAARGRGEPAAALAAADRAALLLHDSAEALLCRAEALLALGRPDEARAAAVRGLQRGPVPGVEERRLRVIAGR